MEKRAVKWKAPDSTPAVEAVIERHYSQLLKWGQMLTRADLGAAREIVHDLCVYLLFSKPDFGGIVNLDGYLYTSLRHIYLGRIARSTREALRFISIGDFDSIQFALTASANVNSVDVQNELRRICCYSLWRKESSKSFSYFILHFFHGYFVREIAEIVCLPIANIYNMLKRSRAELKSYLVEPDKLRFTNRETAPQPTVLWTPVSSAQIFQELRETILEGRIGECLAEEELLAYYGPPSSSPLPSSLLSHVVCCERCLSLIDRHFRRPTLKDRDVLDGFDRSLSRNGVGEDRKDASDAQAMLTSLRKRCTRIYEHRPASLSIAVNGRIVAFYDVQSEHSILSARADWPERVEFVEVFSEQDIRLALVQINSAPPGGPHLLVQSIELSDERWLTLRLTFDGLGLQSEVVYFDSALKAVALDEMEDEPSLSVVAPLNQALLPRSPHDFWSALAELPTRILGWMRPSSAIVWAISILGLLLLAGGYLLHRSPAPLDSLDILNRSTSLEVQARREYAEHHVLHLDETSAGGKTRKGSVDVWQDEATGRYMRRLYNERQQVIAADWRSRDGKSGSYVAINADESDEDRQLVENGLWKQGLSSQKFRELVGQSVRVAITDEGYELTATMGEGHGHLESAVLILDRNFHPIRETMRFLASSDVREFSVVQTDWEHKPSSAVPDEVFAPGALENPAPHQSPSSVLPKGGDGGTEIQLVQLQIAVLYRLNRLHADTGEPIEVSRTADGYIRVSGTVSDEVRKAQIASQMETLPNHQLLKMVLTSQSNTGTSPTEAHQIVASPSSTYNVQQNEAPAAVLIRRHFVSLGWPGDRVEPAEMQFSQDVLRHAQRALQHAYALDRLGNAFAPEELRLAGPTLQRDWAEMVDEHALALESEFLTLHDQIAMITTGAGNAIHPQSGNISAIDTPAAFALATRHLLQETQSLNRTLRDIFAAGASPKPAEHPDSLVEDAGNAIPLKEAREMSGFAAQLKDMKTEGHGKSVGKSFHQWSQ